MTVMCNDNNHADWLKTHLVEFLIQRHREGTFKVDGFTRLPEKMPINKDDSPPFPTFHQLGKKQALC